MKMQNEIQAPFLAPSYRSNAARGEAIEANVPLVVIEPAATEDED